MAESRPFKIAASDADLVDRRRRLKATRWPEAEVVDDWPQGIPLSYVQEIDAYWADDYDWRRAEDALHLICPTLPGYGFSGKPATAGWGGSRRLPRPRRP